MLINKVLRIKYIAWIILILSGFKSFSQVNADFSANITSGCAPLVVQFTDLSSGNPTNWNWNLGNGNNSTT